MHAENVKTDASGSVRFTVETSDPGAAFITATATSAENNTSEFSNCVAVEPPGGLPIIVNATGDTGDLAPGNGLCHTGTVSGGRLECTLRAAIEEANATPGSNVIVFDITGNGPHTIRPGSPLPELSDPVTIDATTQPEFEGSPVVVLDGSNAGETHGLVLTGGGSSIRGLVINRFDGHGILLRSAGYNAVVGNYIGTDVDGIEAAGNTGNGVLIQSGDANVIGGEDVTRSNTIAHNGMHGVQVAAGRGNAILRNQMFENAGLGIDLAGGEEDSLAVTTNDDLDADTGPNDLQNNPDLTSAVIAGDRLQLRGAISSTANTIFRIDVFANQNCDGSGYGEGEIPLAAQNVTSAHDGRVSIDISLPLALLALSGVSTTESSISATATDPSNNTSEHSRCVVISTTTDGEPDAAVVADFRLHQSYPNPFNPRATIPYDVKAPVRVVIGVYDMLGREVARLVDREHSPGRYEAVLDASGLPSGVYFYAARMGSFYDAKRMILVK